MEDTVVNIAAGVRKVNLSNGQQGCCKVTWQAFPTADHRPLTAEIYTEMIFYGGLPSVVGGRGWNQGLL